MARVEVIGDATLYLGDCLDIMPTLDKVDAVIADPPYGTTNCKWDSVIDLERMWSCIDLITNKETPIVLTAQTPFDKVLGVSNLAMLKYEWIWEKTAATGHLNAKKSPMKAHENALVFSGDDNDHWNMMVFYQKQPLYIPQMVEGCERKTTTRRGNYSEVYNDSDKITTYDSTVRYPRSVLKFASDKQTECLHPTQKPVALMKYLVLTYSKPDDIVCDFCCGSATTGVAAVEEGRKFIGIEKGLKEFDIACKRIEEAQRQQKLF